MKAFGITYVDENGQRSVDCTHATEATLLQVLERAFTGEVFKAKQVIITGTWDVPDPGEKILFSCGIVVGVEGIDTGHNWNGWACPLFTRENALEVLRQYNAPEWREKDDNRPESYLDEATGEIVFYEEQWWAESEEYGGGPTRIAPENGLYSIGSGWTWERGVVPWE
jgi:hypothetical protein